MAEPEEMEAVKRAYAEMILNTAKVAAARVMSAELRSRRMEHDLVSTKDEAARLLLGLKQTIDAETKKVEITSLNQQKKVDELESQLNEAEGIIIDLRAELNCLHEQLEETKNKSLHISSQNENTQTCDSDHFTAGDKNTLGRGMPDRECPHLPYKHGDTVNISTDVVKLKEQELFRNGFTQRVCATETSLMQDKSLAWDKSNVVTNSTGIENANAVSSSEILEERVQCGENGDISIVRRSSRKRKLKLLDDFITACGLSKRCVKSGGSRLKPGDEASS